MGRAAPAETLVRMTTKNEGRASLEVDGGGEPGGGPGNIQLGEIHGPLTDCVQRGEYTGRAHMSDSCPSLQRDYQLWGHWPGQSHIEDSVRNYKLTNWDIGPVP